MPRAGWFQRIRASRAYQAVTIDLWLVVEDELIHVDCVAKILFHRRAGVDGCLQGGERKSEAYCRPRAWPATWRCRPAATLHSGGLLSSPQKR